LFEARNEFAGNWAPYADGLDLIGESLRCLVPGGEEPEPAGASSGYDESRVDAPPAIGAVMRGMVKSRSVAGVLIPMLPSLRWKKYCAPSPVE